MLPRILNIKLYNSNRTKCRGERSFFFCFAIIYMDYSISAANIEQWLRQTGKYCANQVASFEDSLSNVWI